MTKYIRNKTGGNLELRGRTIPPNSFFEIPQIEEGSWATDNSVLSALLNPANVTLSADGTTDYSSIAASNIKYLQNSFTPNVKPAALPDPEQYRFRGDSPPWTTCAASTATSLDLTMTEERFVDGGTIIVKDANPGDYCTFQIVHPTAGVVEQFVNKWHVVPGTTQMDVKVYPAKVPAGLIIRVVYNNVGSNPAECGVNLRLHKKGQ